MDTHGPGQGLGKQRLEALTDGIYAIALTLLVLELKLPPLAHGASNADLMAALLAVLPKALTWLLSFWVMVTFWLAQARVYRLTSMLDRGLVWAELAHLALISLLPFSTGLLGEHGDLPAAAVVYSANLLGVAALSSLRTARLLRCPELHTGELTPVVAHKLKVRAWVVSASCLLALVLAFFAPGWNMLAMLPTATLPFVARL